jgi:hypothetical protein
MPSMHFNFRGEKEETACKVWSTVCPAKKVANTVGRSTGTDNVWLHG